MVGNRSKVVWLARIAGDDATAMQLLRDVPGPSWMRSTAEVVLDEHGFPTATPGVWTSLSAWPAEDAAAGERWAKEVGSTFDRAFLARLTPLSYRGDAKWATADAGAPWGELGAPRSDGPAVVVTSVGGDFGGTGAALKFIAAVGTTRESAAKAPGNLGAGILFDLALPGDGLTVTVWESRAAMTAWAYRGDTHPAAMARTGTDWALDRTSFSRLAVEELSGTWVAH